MDSRAPLVLPSRGGAPGRYRLELGPGGEIGSPVRTSTTFDTVGPVPGWRWERFTSGSGEERMQHERTIVVVRDVEELCRLVDLAGYIDVIHQRGARHPFCLRSLP